MVIVYDCTHDGYFLITDRQTPHDKLQNNSLSNTNIPWLMDIHHIDHCISICNMSKHCRIRKL